jgi:DNA-binding LytR/AlgR family response regulator
MFSLFRQPFPFDDSRQVSLIRGVVIGAFVGLFLIVFQPFGIERWQTAYKLVKLAGFGLIAGLLTAGHFVVWPRLFPGWFAESRWSVGRAIGFILTLQLSIAGVNYLYVTSLSGVALTASGFGQSIGVTLLVGIFPTTGAVLVSYLVRLRQYVRSANALSPDSASLTPAGAELNRTDVGADTGLAGAMAEPNPTAAPDPGAPFTLIGDSGRDTLTLTANDLLFIESSDNYATVVYLKQAVPTRVLLRNTLSRLEAQANRPDVVRCHRSFVVNLGRVDRVTGNAQGYKLHLLQNQFAVPVARQYNATLVAQLKK